MIGISSIRKFKIFTPLKHIASRAAGTYTSWPLLKEEHIMISEMCKNFAGLLLLTLSCYHH